MRFIPTGSTVHNVELRPGGAQDGAQRRHGCQIVAKEGATHTATSLDRDAPCPDRLSRHLGTVGNSEHELTSIGKAGRNAGRVCAPDAWCRHEPVDHPSWWRRQDVRWTSPGLPWASPKSYALAKASDKLIIRRRRGRAREVGRECHEVSKRVPSSMPLLKKVDAMNAANEKKVIKTWSRRSTVIPDMVGHTFACTTDVVTSGLRERIDGWSQVGEFAPTRTFRFHAARKDG